MNVTNKRIARGLHDLFEAGVLLKGFDAAVELLFGILLLFINGGALADRIAAYVLLEDPDNFLAYHLKTMAGSLTLHAQLYGALYLLSHGVVKAVLVYGLLRERMWAFPASLAILGLFVFYQLVTYIRNHSILMLALTALDLAVVYLIWHEYQTQLKLKREV